MKQILRGIKAKTYEELFTGVGKGLGVLSVQVPPHQSFGD